MFACDAEFAVANALRQPLGEHRHGVFAINGDELLKCRKQGRMGETIALKPGKDRFGEGFGNESQCCAPVVGCAGVVEVWEEVMDHVESDLSAPRVPARADS